MENKSEDCLAVEEQLERKANRAITVKSAPGLGKNIKHVKEVSWKGRGHEYTNDKNAKGKQIWQQMYLFVVSKTPRRERLGRGEVWLNHGKSLRLQLCNRSSKMPNSSNVAKYQNCTFSRAANQIEMTFYATAPWRRESRECRTVPGSASPLPHFRDGAGRADKKNIQISGTLQNLVPNKPAAQFKTPQDKFWLLSEQRFCEECSEG